ncbi:MAG: anaerobic ribonucleoside-triphosphate reductase activating protein, partial [Nitrososphaeria archaeon]|nr:anaerobic ribonucleoside-triphosphate reductase activating protein [Nitrososphaeria archaeon]
TDVKIPHLQLYGLDEGSSDRMWNSYLESLKVVSESEVEMEVRIPVIKEMDLESFKLEAKEVLNMLKGSRCKFYARVNPILGEPYTLPRNILWASQYCNPSQHDLEVVRETLASIGFNTII